MGLDCLYVNKNILRMYSTVLGNLIQDMISMLSVTIVAQDVFVYSNTYTTIWKIIRSQHSAR